MALVEYLAERGVLKAPAATPSDTLVAAYAAHLVAARGVAPSTVRWHTRAARRFLLFLGYDADEGRLQRLQLSDVDGFITEVSRHLQRISMVQIGVALRVFLRFLSLQGYIGGDLAAAVELPRLYQGERLPRALPWPTVLSLLASIDRSTVTGLRDYAAGVLIATYGLRASEVAGLRLEDIRWRSRVLLVPRPKVGTPLALPLTDAAATALVAYLRVRQATDGERQIFLRVLPPAGPIKRSAILASFHQYAERLGLTRPRRFGPHCFRHSLAMHLLREGTPLKTIADLLGHRSLESTSAYLRLHVDDLRGVALTLPKGGEP
jgi:site-specific recombinase XerD